MNRIQNGASISIACYGDSITYGQDTTASGVATQINGATQTRSTQPFPENMQTALSFIGAAGTITVINRGYPGDSTVQGISRWAGASATDVSLIMYGHNDANNYGSNGIVSIANYRRNMATLIAREQSKGAAVIVLGPPHVQDPVGDNNIRAYSHAAQEVATLMGVMFVDTVDMVETVTNAFTDGTHLTATAYAEIGWQLAGLFAKRSGKMRRVVGGELFYPDDQFGWGNSNSVGNWTGAKGNNRAIQLNAGEIYVLGIDCAADVTPVVHSYRTSGSSQIGVYYAGGGVATRGAPNATIVHDATRGIRQKLVCPELKKGSRFLVLRNDAAGQAFIEAIEFVRDGYLHVTRGTLRRSLALSGMFQPARESALQDNWWACADYSNRLAQPYSIVANLTLSDTVQNGLAIWRDLPVSGEILCPNALFVLRAGTQLVIRDWVNSSANDTYINSVFPTGVWTGEIELDVSATSADVYVNGTLAGSRPNPTNVGGYPGLLAAKTARMTCNGLYVTGQIKGPY
ncbi:SGNH/GDSL hydrolase family protein [Burkholderia cepacia]|uniref:SGNH/GDSL hydrolase family protein n=1 Tax=Burkholderia cepacia TaxID=292 RepID=UPI00163B52A6|nr:GDSL-type esterase/lipase family protein [Burkholderia cepacia]